MPKMILTIIFLIVFLTLLYALTVSEKHTDELGKYTTRLLRVGFIITLLCIFILGTNEERTIEFLYCLYFGCFSLLCKSLFDFSLVYTDWLQSYRCCSFFAMILVAIDSVSLVLNFFFHHVYDPNFINVKGDIFMLYTRKAPMLIHLLLCYVLVAASLFLLIKKSQNSPKIYKKQYYIIILVFLCIALVNALFVLARLDFDISILAFGVGSLIIVYYVYSYSPKDLTFQVASRVLTDMNESALLFDNHERCIYRNSTALEEFGTRFECPEDVYRFFGLSEKISSMPDAELEIAFKEKTYILRQNVLYEDQDETKMIGSYLVIEDITDRIKKRKIREFNLNHDRLTGFYSWHYFEVSAHDLMQTHPEQEYCIVLTNLYQFKLYNEVFGRDAGDELLRNIGDLYKKIMVPDQMIFGRVQDDKFVMCIPAKLCTEANLHKYHIIEPVQHDNFKILNYVGIYHVEDSTEPISTMVERAAIAINTIRGTNNYFVSFDTTMKADLLWENTLAGVFHQALADGEFQIYIQPQVDLSTGKLVGGEALVRWIRSDGEMISPGRFVPILEKKGMINLLDLAIWDESFQFAKELYEQGYEVPISVNLSSQDFYYFNLYEVFRSLLKKYDIPARLIRLEITESEMLQDVQKQVKVIRKLQNEGFIFEMDDFGSGYSSLNSLKDIPVDVVKLDMKFIEGTGKTASSPHWIIEAIIRLSESHGIPVLVEGVETAEQVAYLERIGCQYIQGYYYSKPIPKDEFVAYRKKHGYRSMI